MTKPLINKLNKLSTLCPSLSVTLVFHLTLPFSSLSHFISHLPPFFSSLLHGVTKGARCLVGENVPTYQKAPGFLVEAAKRRKRSSWIQWVQREGWGLQRTVINTSSREAVALKGHSEWEPVLNCFVPYFLFEISIDCSSLLCINFHFEICCFDAETEI